MTVVARARPEGLRNERVQSHEQAPTEQTQHDEQVAAQTDGAHAGRAVGESADHHGVHDGHAHPAELRENERNREPQRGTEFGAKCLKSNHGRKIRGTSVSGPGKMSKRMRRGSEVISGGPASKLLADYSAGIKGNRNSCNLSLSERVS